MKSLKKLGKKLVFIVLICIVVFIILLLQCFVFNKNEYNPRNDTSTNYLKSGKGISSSNGKNSNSNSSVLKDAYGAYQNTDVSGKDYNTYNFDDSILMYEGDRDKEYTNSLLEKLIKNTEDSFYSRPSVTLVNFGNNNSITYTTVEEYKSKLEQAKEALEDGATYNISFGYTALRAVVNEIIITKK
jgi:hypothetical protein